MLNALILGLIQGLSEFLPISSSGHVNIAEILLKEATGLKDEPGFSAAIHLATCFAAIIYFRGDIAKILRGLAKFSQPSEEKKLGLEIIIATFPAIIIGIIVSAFGIEKLFETPLAIGISAIIFGLLLLYSEKVTKADEGLNFKKAAIIGASQIIAAVFPGASRSGVTLTTSFLLNIKKDLAAKFIFLISIPITALASINEIVIDQSVKLNTDFAIAFVAAFFSGLFAIKFLLYFIQKTQLKWLVLYRIIFGVIAIWIGLNQ